MAVVDELSAAGRPGQGQVRPGTGGGGPRLPARPGDRRDGPGAAVLVRDAQHDLFSLGTAEARAAGPARGRDAGRLPRSPTPRSAADPVEAAVARALALVSIAPTTILAPAPRPPRRRARCTRCRPTDGSALVALGMDVHRAAVRAGRRGLATTWLPGRRHPRHRHPARSTHAGSDVASSIDAGQRPDNVMVDERAATVPLYDDAREPGSGADGSAPTGHAPEPSSGSGSWSCCATQPGAARRDNPGRAPDRERAGRARRPGARYCSACTAGSASGCSSAGTCEDRRRARSPARRCGRRTEESGIDRAAASTRCRSTWTSTRCRAGTEPSHALRHPVRRRSAPPGAARGAATSRASCGWFPADALPEPLGQRHRPPHRAALAALDR